METMHGALNLLREKIHPAFFFFLLFFDEGEQPKVTLSQVGTVGGMGQNLDVLRLWENHNDLGFMGTGVTMKEKGLTGANDLALLTYCFYYFG